jgi:hypothetical protein
MSLNWIITLCSFIRTTPMYKIFIHPFYIGPWFAYSVTILCFINDFCDVIVLLNVPARPSWGSLTWQLICILYETLFIDLFFYYNIFIHYLCYSSWRLYVRILTRGSPDLTKVRSWHWSACTRVVRSARPSEKLLVRVFFLPHLPSRDFSFIGKGVGTRDQRGCSAWVLRQKRTFINSLLTSQRCMRKRQLLHR